MGAFPVYDDWKFNWKDNSISFMTNIPTTDIEKGNCTCRPTETSTGQYAHELSCISLRNIFVPMEDIITATIFAYAGQDWGECEKATKEIMNSVHQRESQIKQSLIKEIREKLPKKVFKIGEKPNKNGFSHNDFMTGHNQALDEVDKILEEIK